jgi:hypothetical protein
MRLRIVVPPFLVELGRTSRREFFLNQEVHENGKKKYRSFNKARDIIVFVPDRIGHQNESRENDASDCKYR